MPSQPEVSLEEEHAIEYVRDLKGFYSHAVSYALTIPVLFIINYQTTDYMWAWWPTLGWGIGLLSHGLQVFEVFDFYGQDWEKRQVEKRLGRKLWPYLPYLCTISVSSGLGHAHWTSRLLEHRRY